MAPTLHIQYPLDGQRFIAPSGVVDIPMTVQVTGSEPNQAVEVLLDGKTVGVLADGGFVYESVPLGDHVLRARIVASDGVSAVADEVVVSVALDCEDDAECDDGESCTVDTCAGGSCAHAPYQTPECAGEGGAIPSCKDDADCTELVPGGQPCWVGVCTTEGQCAVQPGPDGEPCSDGDPCTIGDACAAGECAAGAPQPCDDGIDCTVDSCNARLGCTHAPDSSLCPAGGQCSVGVCDAGSGCGTGPGPDGAACDDGNACTAGDACAGGACVPGGAATCDDGNPCTADSCAPATGCAHAPVEGVECDDGDGCSTLDSCTGGQCVGTMVAPVCLEPDTICGVAGKAGKTVECDLLLAASAASEELAAAIQFNTLYSGALLAFQGFFDETCVSGAGCFAFPATGPDGKPLSTGHQVSILPEQQDWKGNGSALIVHMSNPLKPLTTAWLDGTGQIVGDPVFLKARFTLLQTVASTDPAFVKLNVLAADAAAATLTATMQAGAIITHETQPEQ